MKHSSSPATDGLDNQMYLVDLSGLTSAASSLDGLLDETRGLWQSIYERMTDDETLWVIAPNEYSDGRLWPVSMATADFAREESGLTLKNTISIHTWEDRGGDMEGAYDEILFFVRNKRKYQFHKDRIRVAHVYQGHEWGGEREEGNSSYHDTTVQRYNSEGKDPGNVWLDEDRTQSDDQSVDQTGHLPMGEAVRRCALVGSSEEETVYVVGGDGSFTETIEEENRVVESIDIETIRCEAA